MGLKFDPIGGGQFKQAVKQIMEAERQPVRTLEARKVREEAKLKLHQDFKVKFANMDRTLQEFQNFQNFREFKVELGDGEGLVAVTVDKTKAQPGSYMMQIDQMARRSSVISNGFSDPDEPQLGIGFAVFDLPNGDSKEVFIDPKHASLRGVASVINREADMPVQASVVKDASNPDQPWRLIMTAKNDGLDDSIGFPELYFLDGEQDFWYDGNQGSENAILKIDGFEIESDTNKIQDFLQGVNIRVRQADPDKTFELVITEDNQKMAGKVKGLVDQINGILEFINKQNQVDDKTDTSNTFAGDTSLQSIEYRIRNLLHDRYPVGDWEDYPEKFMTLPELGIGFDKTGMLTFNEQKFTKLLEGNFQEVADAITSEFGFASRMREVMGAYTRSNTGFLAQRENNLRSRVKAIDEQIAQKEQRLDQRNQRLTEQFSRLQGSLANLQRQQAALSSIGGGGGGNIVSQLLGG